MPNSQTVVYNIIPVNRKMEQKPAESTASFHLVVRRQLSKLVKRHIYQITELLKLNTD